MFYSSLLKGRLIILTNKLRQFELSFSTEYVNVWNAHKLAGFLNLPVVSYIPHTVLLIIPLIPEVRCDSYYKIIVHSVLENISNISILELERQSDPEKLES